MVMVIGTSASWGALPCITTTPHPSIVCLFYSYSIQPRDFLQMCSFYMLLSFITKNQINQAEGIRKQSPMYPVLAAAQLGIVLDNKLSACIAFKSNILEVPFWLQFLQSAWLWHRPAQTNFLCKLSFSFHKVIVRIEGIYMQEVLGNWGTEPAPSTRKACHTERRKLFPLFASFLLQYQHILFTPQLLSLHTHTNTSIF